MVLFMVFIVLEVYFQQSLLVLIALRAAIDTMEQDKAFRSSDYTQPVKKTSFPVWILKNRLFRSYRLW